MNFKKAFKKHFLQYFFVFVAFFLMVYVSHFHSTRIAQSLTRDNGIKVLDSARLSMRSMLFDGEALLSYALVYVEEMLDNGLPTDEIPYYFMNSVKKMSKKSDRFDGLSGVYGSVAGTWLQTDGFIPDNSYILEERPWYKEALKNPRGFAYTGPYKDVKTGQLIFSISHCVNDPNGNVIGVLSVDVLGFLVSQYIDSLNISGHGFGILLNENLDVVSCKAPGYQGVNLLIQGENVSESMVDMAAKIKQNGHVDSYSFKDADGRKNVAFFTELFNNWYVGVITTAKDYNRGVDKLGVVLSILGFILMCMLNFLLLRFSVAKLRSDEKNQMKSDFLANMSHEIRTPMNAILGMSELALRCDIPPDVRGFINNIKSAGNSLLTIINDILDFSKIEAGKLEIVETPYQTASVLSDIANMTMIRIADKPIDFIVDIDNSLPFEILGDEIRLRQILINLLSNAVKFTKKGHVRLSVHKSKTLENELRIYVEIADSGIGIKKEDMDKLFTSFTQVDTKRNRNVEGTGLGLIISKRLTEIMGGTIWVESRYGEGSVFSFYIVAKPHDEREMVQVDEVSKKKVLVLEINELLRDNASRALYNLNIKNHVTSDADDFIYRLQKSFEDEESYSHIILPESRYNELCQTLREYAPGSIVTVIRDIANRVALPDNVRQMRRPCHILSFASVLNNENVQGTEIAEMKVHINFIAPEAEVMVVDDNDVNLAVACGMLEPYKVKITTASSAAMCFSLLENNVYDLIFMDHMMPVMDGMEATAKIRSSNDVHLKNMPIIALTANAISGVREMYMSNGFTDFLSKPIDHKKLGQMLYTFLPREKIQKSEKILPRLNSRQESPIVNEKILKVIYTDGLRKIPQIKLLFLKKDIKNYTIEVHALKSVAAQAGEKDLSEMAREHEEAGKREDFEFIKNNFNKLIDRYQKFIDNLSYLAPDKDNGGQKKPISGGEVLSLFAKIKGFAEGFNIDGIGKVLDELDSYELEEPILSMVSELKDAAAAFNYDQIIKILSE